MWYPHDIPMIAGFEVKYALCGDIPSHVGTPKSSRIRQWVYGK